MSLDSDGAFKRKFVDGKVSKVKFVVDNNDQAYRFITGFWDSPCNSICCWNIVDLDNSKDGSSIEKAGTIKTSADVNDLYIISQRKFVVGLGDGTLKFVDILENGNIIAQHTTSCLHKKGSITAVCVLGENAYVGSDTGQIVTVFGKNYSSNLFASNLMKICSLTSCGTNQLVSGHLTGQIHLWDIRAKPVAFTIPELSHIIPEISKASSTLNDAITAIASHPAEPNVIAYGTSSGSVSFVDIRQPDEALPSLFKIAKDSINHLKFNPSYPGNFFSSSSSSIVHWDASLMSTTESRTSLDGMETNSLFQKFETKEPLNVSVGNNARQVKQRTNIWLSSKVWNSVQLKALLEDDSKYINTFDVSKDSIIIGSNTSDIILLENVNF